MLQEGGEAAKVETMMVLIKIITDARGDGTLLRMFRMPGHRIVNCAVVLRAA
jgi:hypothetical protein